MLKKHSVRTIFSLERVHHRRKNWLSLLQAYLSWSTESAISATLLDMTIIRLPNLLNAVSELQWRVHYAEKEITQASEEWFSRSLFPSSEILYPTLISYCF